MSILKFLVVAIAFASGAASAQPKPALVQDRDTAARDPVQAMQLSAPIDCGSQSCAVAFNGLTVPAGRRLVINQLWVVVNGTNPNPNGFTVSLTDVPMSAAIVFDGPGRPSGGARVLQPLVFYVEAGRFPYLSINANDDLGTMSVVVTLTGHWINLP